MRKTPGGCFGLYTGFTASKRVQHCNNAKTACTTGTHLLVRWLVRVAVHKLTQIVGNQEKAPSRIAVTAPKGQVI